MLRLLADVLPRLMRDSVATGRCIDAPTVHSPTDLLLDGLLHSSAVSVALQPLVNVSVYEMGCNDRGQSDSQHLLFAGNLAGALLVSGVGVEEDGMGLQYALRILVACEGVVGWSHLGLVPQESANMFVRAYFALLHRVCFRVSQRAANDAESASVISSSSRHLKIWSVLTLCRLPPCYARYFRTERRSVERLEPVDARLASFFTLL